MKNLALVLLIAMISCKNVKKETISAQSIVDKSIELSGGDLYETKKIAFNFRDVNYDVQIIDGKKEMRRITKNDSVLLTDIVAEDFKRYNNKELVAVPDSMAVKYTNSINSVFYFALLPYGLNDEAVTKKHLGDVVVNGKHYYKVKVTFAKENGGEDYEDVYVYWFNKETFMPDYLAYKFYTDGGGIRFRAAYNERVVDGIRFVDYENYAPIKADIPFMQIDSLYEKNELKLLSKIELKAISLN